MASRPLTLARRTGHEGPRLAYALTRDKTRAIMGCILCQRAFIWGEEKPFIFPRRRRNSRRSGWTRS